MKRTLGAIIMLAVGGGALLSAAAVADPYHGREDRDHYDNGGYHDHYDGDGRDRREYRDNGRHAGWHRGDRVGRSEWLRYSRIDYRRYNLRRPPRGYEWRMVNDDYVLAALAGGLIADIVAGHGRY